MRHNPWALYLAGLVDFCRGPARHMWTDTGINVPDYPRLAQLWWQSIGEGSAAGVPFVHRPFEMMKLFPVSIRNSTNPLDILDRPTVQRG
jgi:hypothetical protein